MPRRPYDIFQLSDKMLETVPMVMQHIPGSWFAVEIKSLLTVDSKGTHGIVSRSYAEKYWFNNEMIFRFDKNPTKSHTTLQIAQHETAMFWRIWMKHIKICKQLIKSYMLTLVHDKTTTWTIAFPIDVGMQLSRDKNRNRFQNVLEWIISQNTMSRYSSETNDEKQDAKEDITIRLNELTIPDFHNDDSPLARLYKIFSLNRRLFDSQGIGIGSSLLIGLDIDTDNSDSINDNASDNDSNDDIKDDILVDIAILTSENCLNPKDKIRLSIHSTDTAPTKNRHSYDDLDLEMDNKRVITNKMGKMKGDAAIAIAKQIWTFEETGFVKFVFVCARIVINLASDWSTHVSQCLCAQNQMGLMYFTQVFVA